MKTTARTFALLAGVALCGLAFAERPSGLPNNYPSKPIRIVISSPPGGALDSSGRQIGQKLAERWGVSVVAENRAGTGIPFQYVSRQAPDGYTLMVASTSIMYSSYLLKPPYDVRKKFPPIAQFLAAPFVMAVTNDLPVKTFPELLNYAKANPNKLNYSHTGPGTAAQLAGELLKLMAKIDMVGIPFAGVGQGYVEQMAGRIHITFGTAASSMPLVKGGKIRAIAVTTQQRAKSLPDLPAIAEYLPGFDNIDVWVGLLGVEGMPEPIIAALNREVNAILATPDVTKVLTADGSEIAPKSPEAFGKVIAQAIDSADRIIREAKIPMQ